MYLVDSSLVPAFFSAALHVEVILHLFIILKSEPWVGKSKRKEQVQDECAQPTSDVKVYPEEHKLQHDRLEC